MNLSDIPDNQDISWEVLSEGWPDTPYTKEKWSACVKGKVVPYGEYVVVGTMYTYPISQPDGSYYDRSNAVIRCSNARYIEKLELINH